eukprot:Em0001g2205a
MVERQPEYSGGLGTAHPTRATRPVVTPDAYTGDSSWTDWADHFEAVAKVNGWDDSIKLNWLPVRLTGKAQTAWKRLSDETKGGFQAAMDALRNRFEPSSKRETLRAAEFCLRKRKNGEQWGDFADQLRCLSDKAFPTLSEDAKEVLTLDRYLVTGICGISRNGFQKSCVESNITFKRFGHGFYLAPHSSKCHDYTQGTHTHRAMLLCDVLSGKKHVVQTNQTHLVAPPQGYDSVYGQPGGSLNYPEIVIYEASILSRYVIIYQKDGVGKIAAM